MKEYRIIIPEEKFQLIKFKQEELPGIALINSGLKYFEPKEVFSWHCSIMIHFKNIIENGMPSEEERVIVDDFGDWLDNEIKGKSKNRPNALFLARITWNKTRELIWRVFDPKITNQFLQEIISKNNYDKSFDFRIDPDKKWKLADWHLNNC